MPFIYSQREQADAELCRDDPLLAPGQITIRARVMITFELLP